MAREYYSRPLNSGYTVVDGTTTGSYASAYPSLIATWMEYKVLSTDIATNQSTVSVKLYSQVLDGGATTNMAEWDSAENFGYAGYDNANRVYRSTSYNFNNKNLNTFADATLTVPHNTDGTKTITLQAAFTTRSSSVTGGSASASVTLPTIAQKTTISSVTGLKFGFATQIALSRKATNLRENVTLTIGGSTLTLKTTASADTTFNYTLARSYAPNTALPCALSGTLTVTTYNGSTSLGSVTQSVTFTVDANDAEFKPTINVAPTVAPYNDVIPALGTYVALAGYSKLRMTASPSDITTKYGATIVSRTVTFQNGSSESSLTASTFTSSLQMAAGEQDAYYKITDSRGFTAEWGIASGYITQYTEPSVSTWVYRGNAEGYADGDGTYIWWRNITGSFTTLGIPDEASTRTIEYSIDNETWTTVTQGSTIAVVTNADPSYGRGFYTRITDSISQVSQYIYSPSERDYPIFIPQGGHGLGIGTSDVRDSSLTVEYEALFYGMQSAAGLTTINGAWMEMYPYDESHVSSQITGRGISVNYMSSDIYGSTLGEHGFVTGGYYSADNDYHYSEHTLNTLTVNDHDILRLTPMLAQVWSTSIPSGADLNTVAYLKPGTYFTGSSATAATFANCPTPNAFKMVVEAPIQAVYDDESTLGYRYRVRTITDLLGNQWIQYAYSSGTAGVFAYGAWNRIVTEATYTNGTLTANVGTLTESYCRQAGRTVDIHGWLTGLSTSTQTHERAITVSGVLLPTVAIKFITTCWLGNSIASYAGYGTIDTSGRVTFVKPLANSDKVSFHLTYVG